MDGFFQSHQGSGGGKLGERIRGYMRSKRRNLRREDRSIGSEKSYVIDSSAFIQGFTEFAGARCVTSQAVLDEVLGRGVLQSRVRNMVEQQVIKVLRPARASLRKAMEAARETGDMKKLSGADIDVIALALDERMKGFQPVITSDDYSIQNVANKLSLSSTGAAFPGIRRQLSWIWYCPACFRTYEEVESDVCLACGTRLKRKPHPGQSD